MKQECLMSVIGADRKPPAGPLHPFAPGARRNLHHHQGPCMKTKLHSTLAIRQSALTALLAAAALALGPVPSYANRLANPGFEPDLSGWYGWGNAFAETDHFRSGTRALKLYGQFSGSSGAYQIRSARAGETWTFSGYGLTPGDDVLAGANAALLKIVWFDGPNGTGNQLQPLPGPGALFGSSPGIESARLTNGTPMDIWHFLCAGGAAPPGTMSAQLLALFYQPAMAQGAAWFDDLAATATGDWGNALSFDGTNDFLVVSNVASVVPTSQVTVEFWQRAHQATNQVTFSLDPDVFPTNRFLACTPWLDQVIWDFGDIGNQGRLTYVPPPSEPLTNCWQHLALVASNGPSGFMAIYRNGAQVAYKNGAGSPCFTNGLYDLCLGRVGGAYYFDGELDDFRIWNVARTAEQIRDNLWHPLTGLESNLVLYLSFDEGAGASAYDSTTNRFQGRLFEGASPGNGPAWVNSMPPFIKVADLPGVSASSVAWGDYDNDGRLDFLLTGSTNLGYPGISQVWRNTGSGFTNVPIPGLLGVSGGSVAWGDYDNDGRLDFLLTGAGIAQVWRNTGSGFANVTATVAPGLPEVYYSSVAWGDYDNDGRLDILLTGDSDDEGYVAQVWRNTGSGFANVTATVAPGLLGVYLGSVAWGDYDNDGRLDFLLTGDTGLGYDCIAQVWRNTGSGFANVTATVAPALPGVYHSSVAWGDYDNDGRLDFLLTGLQESYLNTSQVWRNTGSSFANVTATVAPGLPEVSYSSVAWGDYDNDGRLDFLLTGYSYSGLISQVWRNTGSGFTSVIIPGLPGVGFSAAAWGDYDNDGRLDILLTGDTGSGLIAQVWRNSAPEAYPNTLPWPPTDLTASVDGQVVNLDWAAGGDPQTPTNGLTYNLRVGTTPGGFDVVSPHANPTNGYRRLPALGNAQHRLGAQLNLPPGLYYWGVQAVDSAFAGSPFAAETTFAVPGPQIITGISAGTNGVVTLHFRGGPTNTYLVQITTNLSAPVWVTISTNVADMTGAWSFTDYSASNCPARFYRSTLP
jgi:hypothetical protein